MPKVMDADHELVDALVNAEKRNRKLVRSSTYAAPAVPNMTIRSWKMNEFKYYEVPSPFPTLARGLFTTWQSDDPANSKGEGRGRHRIVTRGYDKFFNIGEVPWTTWTALENHTSPPYVMTLKSNGCIIFISALTETKLLVTSKHSLGPIQNVEVSHAQMGEKWLLRHLEAKSKTPEELAQVLWKNNWTAVAELCDDSFEEHVLPYSADKTGLHLHGINESTGTFRTVLSGDVAAFAREWGLIQTPYHTVDSIAQVRSFSEEVANTGEWNGEPIEGFVVRSHVSSEVSKTDRSAPPYPPGSSFFFKVKYDEPYMMYRDWREITKSLLAAKGPIQEVSIPKSKLRRPESHLYLKWVRDEIMRDRKQFGGFSHGKGIIATRERFLKQMEKERAGNDLLAEQMGAMSIGGQQEKTFGKTIIVPVAVPGCGKTTVAVALKQLFGFGHVQSDDIHAKKPAPAFIRSVLEELKTHDIVIADKNNHKKQHREQLLKAVENVQPPLRLMALYWSLDKPPALIHRICGDRVMDRGDNHQTLRADASRKHEDAIWMFIKDTEELDDREVDEIVEMDLAEDLEQSLDRAVDACVQILALRKPSQEEIGSALAAARTYKPSKRKEDSTERKKKSKGGMTPRYYALVPEVDIERLIEGRLAEEGITESVREDVRKFWLMLVKDKRVTTLPHITLVHEKSLPQEQDLWDSCRSLFLSSSPPTFEFELGHLLLDGRVMAVTVEGLKVATNPGKDTSKEAINFVEQLNGSLKNMLHITVGTRSSDIPPYEARGLVESWKKGKASKSVRAIQLKSITVKGRVKGLMQ